jgi:hypothetical protein
MATRQAACTAELSPELHLDAEHLERLEPRRHWRRPRLRFGTGAISSSSVSARSPTKS